VLGNVVYLFIPLSAHLPLSLDTRGKKELTVAKTSLVQVTVVTASGTALGRGFTKHEHPVLRAYGEKAVRKLGVKLACLGSRSKTWRFRCGRGPPLSGGGGGMWI